MAHTPEQRDNAALCGAKKRNGEKCRAFAGQGTDHFGIGACSFHLGRTQTHSKAALKLEAKRKMVTYGEPVKDADSVSALMNMLQSTAGHVAWAQQMLATLDPEELATPAGQAVASLYDSERDRLTRIATACSNAGVDEAAIRVSELQIAKLGRALALACADAGLSREVQARVGSALRRRLAETDGDVPQPQLAA